MKVFTIIFILTSLSITVAWAQSAKAEIATGLDIVNESGVAFLDFYRNGRSGYLEASGDDMRLVAEDDRADTCVKHRDVLAIEFCCLRP